MSAAPLLLLVFSLAARGDGYDFLRQGKPAYARTAFRNQLRKRPGDPDLLAGLGLAELALGNPDEAISRLLEAISQRSDHYAARIALSDALLLRAKARIATGRFDDDTRYILLDAADQAQAAVRIDDTAFKPWVVITRARLELGQLDEARFALQNARARGVADSEAQVLDAEIRYFEQIQNLEELGDQALEDALAALRAMLETQPDSIDLWLRLGDLYHNEQQWDQALDAYEGALALDPFHKPCLELLMAYLPFEALRPKTERLFEKTLEAAKTRASRTDPRPGFALYCVAQTRLFRRQYAEAAQLFRDALKRDPLLNIRCQLGIGEAEFRENRYKESAAAYLDAIRSDPAEVVAILHHQGRAKSVEPCLTYHAGRFVEAKKQNEARDLLGIAADLVPEHPTLLNDYAFLCRETGKYKEAYRAYSKLVERKPNHPRSLNDCALIMHYHLKTDLDHAAELYQRAIDAAQQIIDNPEAPIAEKQSAKSAMKDARANLKKLQRQSEAEPRLDESGAPL